MEQKKVLFIHYSQTGQLSRIVNELSIPFISSGMKVENIRVKLESDFAFPWTSKRFFDAMPESVLCIPNKLSDFTPQEKSYDLIIFAWQPWYLNPSIPATSILADSRFNSLLKDTPTLTLIGARNMWLNAQEKVKQKLKKYDANHIGNIVLTDKGNNFISAITILHWMLSGKQDKFLGVFPKPGISDADISGVAKYSNVVMDALQNGKWNDLQKRLVDEGAVEVKTNLMFIEARAPFIFHKWAELIIKKKNRNLWLRFFKYYLFIALFVIAPIVLTVYMLIFKPFLRASILKKKRYFQGLNN